MKSDATPGSGEIMISRPEGARCLRIENAHKSFAHLPTRLSLNALYPDVSRLATFFHAASRRLTMERRTKAEGRRQKAEGKRQKAGGRRQTTGGGRQEADGREGPQSGRKRVAQKSFPRTAMPSDVRKAFGLPANQH